MGENVTQSTANSVLRYKQLDGPTAALSLGCLSPWGKVLKTKLETEMKRKS